MKSFLKGTIASLKTSKSGFTLVELLVVVGIIVALGAVIVPNVLKFANRGDEGAMSAESASVQAAMDAMMADHNPLVVQVVTANDVGTTGDGINDWTAVPAERSLAEYLRKDTTEFFYCWDTTGLITDQFPTAVTACVN